VKRSNAANAAKHPRSSTSPEKAQRRLNARWRQLRDSRRKPGGVVAVAIARELAAYCWEIATCPTALQPDTHTNHSQEAYQLALTLPEHFTPLRLARRPEHPGSRTTTPRFVA
jgi:hypothetical protein